jgi:plasmid replication initiation protein
MEQHLKLLRETEEQRKENSPEAAEAKRLATQAIDLTRYRNERNLMLYPFCSTSRRKRLKTINYKSADGQRWLEVSASHEYGMVKIWDFDVLRFALSKAGEIANHLNYFPPFVEFSAYECLKALGKDTKGSGSFTWLEGALARLLSTTYRGNIFRDDTKLVIGFTLIRFEYKKNEDGSIGNIRINFDERLVESVRYNKGLLAIDQEVLKESSGIRKRLLELVKVSKGSSEEWTVNLIRLAEMCSHEGELKEFKRNLKLYRLPWQIKFSKRFNGEDKVTFFNKS